MKSKLTMMVAMATACVAIQLTAMPTAEETRRAEPVVRKLMASERAALKSGRKTRSEVADAAMKLADEADTDAAKLLLMKGAFVLYVQDGNLEKAAETMNALETAIADMPPQSVTNMIEAALLGASKKVDGAQLYKLLDEKRGADRPNVEYKFFYKLENGKAIITGVDPKSVGTAGPVGSLVIPDKIDGHSVTHIGWESFRYCKELTSVTIPEGVTHIDGHAFDQCYGLKSVTLPSSLKDIGWAAFGACAGLTSVTIPNGVKGIAADAFNGCRSLKNVVIPNSVTRIGDRAFCGCRELESATIPAGVASIGSGVFGGCNALKLIQLDSGNSVFTLIDGALYTKDRTELVMWPNPPKAVTIPDGVTNIRGWAFTGGSGMTSVTIPESVTRIGGITFIGCAGLKSITIPSRVKSMGEHVFERCVELTEVTMLGERPDAPVDLFPGCRKLKAIHVPANAKSWAGMKEWFGIPLVFDGEVRAASEKTLNNGNAASPTSSTNGLWIVAQYNGSKSISCLADAQKLVEQTSKVAEQTYQTLSFVNNDNRCGNFPHVEFPGTVGSVDLDHFVITAKGCIYVPYAGDWTFACRSDDGFRFVISGNELSDTFEHDAIRGFWQDTLLHTVHFPCAGIYSVTCLFFENWGNAGLEYSVARGKHSRFDSSVFKLVGDPESGIVMAGDAKDAGRQVQAERGDAPGGALARLRERRMRLMRETRAANVTAQQQRATVDGIEWTYNLIGGQAQVDYASSSNATGAISIPSTLGGFPVTSIGRNEFRSGFGWRVFEKCCDNMTSVTIPSGVVNIGDSAFSGCSNLVSVTIPASVTNIARCAFSRCSRLTSFTVDDKNTKYSSRNGLLCSKDGTALIAGVNGDVTIPSSVKDIVDYAFQGRIGLKSVIIPSSVHTIGTFAFDNCSGLKSVAIPASMRKIGWYAFSGCSRLMSFSVDSDNPLFSSRNGMLCSKDGSTLVAGVNGDVTIPSCVKEIGYHAFSNCSGLRSVQMPANVTSIAAGAFRGCDSLPSVTISPRVTSIGPQAFYWCKKLASVTIPASVTKIERSAFSDCSELTSFSVDPGNPSYSSRNGLLCSKDGSMLVVGVNGDVTIPSGVKDIADHAFQGCIGLTSVAIPSSVTNIGYQAFDKCEGLTSVAIPSSVKRIGNRAFTMCSKIKSVTIPEGVTGIGEYAFAWCFSIESVTIPQGVTSIGDYAFCNCSRLTSVTMLGERLDIPSNVFQNCDKLKSIHVPAHAKSWMGMRYWHGIPLVFDKTDGTIVEDVYPMSKTDGLEVEEMDFASLKALAENGDAKAMCELGSRYRRGIDVSIDNEEASRWTMKAVSNGNERATAVCYSFGYGVAKDAKEAVKWYMKAVDKGDRGAMNNLGVCYERGDGVEKNAAEAAEWIRMAADKGFGLAMSNLSRYYYYGIGVGKDYKESLKWMRMLAEKGNAEGMFEFGVFYLNGKVVEKDEREAVKWFRRAAEKGHLKAMHNLGFFYANGIGVEKDEKEAVKWYQMAAEKGHSRSMHNLSICYANGDGVEKNMKEALRWCRIAAEKGEVAAMYKLGSFYANGVGVEKDEKEAVKWYRMAADKDDKNKKNNITRGRPPFRRDGLIGVRVGNGSNGHVQAAEKGEKPAGTVPQGAMARLRERRARQLMEKQAAEEKARREAEGEKAAEQAAAEREAQRAALMQIQEELRRQREEFEERDKQRLYMIVDLTKTGKRAITYLDEAPKGGWGDEFRTKKMALRKIAPGSFEYLPGKSFKITKPFYIGIFEVTQKQYEMVMKENPSEFKGDVRPVERVVYLDIRGTNKGLNWPQDNKVDDDSYLGKLRKRIGLEFDLPTEVQWEYACRAGAKGDFNVDGVELVKLGKYAGNDGQSNHHVKVGSFMPNAWGLYDMHGNVWEWCLDRAKGNYGWAVFSWKSEPKESETDPKGPAVGASRIHRGGSWLDGSEFCRSSSRHRHTADFRSGNFGFRLACPAK